MSFKVYEVVRVLLLALLTMVELVVRPVCTLAMLLGIVVAIVFELSAAGPTFEFLRMLVGSLGFAVALVMYYGLMALVSR